MESSGSITAYLAVLDAGESGPGAVVAAIEKGWWDKNGTIDDCDTPECEKIADAMIACGAQECGDGLFALPRSLSPASLMAAMKKRGVALVITPAFTKWARSHLA